LENLTSKLAKRAVSTLKGNDATVCSMTFENVRKQQVLLLCIRKTRSVSDALTVDCCFLFPSVLTSGCDAGLISVTRSF
jgi:hypothetical protein